MVCTFTFYYDKYPKLIQALYKLSVVSNISVEVISPILLHELREDTTSVNYFCIINENSSTNDHVDKTLGITPFL
ncbi:MAG: hypothetical protein ACD_18C00319G0005 [uncultured bacterium]|nr:MAG: hypothetical protein ACD_18C00319G0005 [uncultured bacterium]OGH83877.1 MAG: hypothetical protein A2488_01780 [Candidatus Magasanikbacteria bacterium RIFOXYC12_FULL_32_21b]OGH89166.1 MAG: hypothetical protein A2507_04385 [Candidatus Magasanikbacteria bacterium RIFOXYD12_FULL_33_17]HAO52573.1 hypothetical protein [Candidatus Magasanikbacteria bacterium]